MGGAGEAVTFEGNRWMSSADRRPLSAMIKRPRPADLLLWRSPAICFGWAVVCFLAFIAEGKNAESLLRLYFWLTFSIVSFASGVWHYARKGRAKE
jgi:hypothetical protein